MNTPMGTQEVDFKSSNGYALALIILIVLLAIPATVISQVASGNPNEPLIVLTILVGIPTIIFLMAGFYMLQPNQSALMTLFGSYRGTDYATGLRWANPFMRSRKVSLRLRNFNSEKLKVNDKRGNPIEIAAAVVWRVNDTARAVLDIDHYEHYVPIQAEAALRHLANEYAYDHVDDDGQEMTLRAGGDELKDGAYAVRLDMVNEGVCWFAQTGSPTPDVTLDVRA